MTRFGCRKLAIVIAAFLLCHTAIPSVVAATTGTLHVLLTNDDGYDAPGIAAVHEALLAAGYRVTVVAPRDQQSGSSMRVTMGKLAAEQVSAHVWTVDGTPADAVAFAIHRVLDKDRPDVVVSGANFGQNLGGNTNLSGTVGAAIMATQLHIPAIAVSVGIDLGESDAQPARFPSTAAAFPRAAAFTVRLLRQLEDARSKGAALLPPYRLLNVNYPALPPARIRGVRIARVARTGGFEAAFVATDTPGDYRIDLHHVSPEDALGEAADTVLFAAGHVTISVLDGSLDAGDAAVASLAQRLGTLATVHPADAPATAAGIE